MKNSDYWNVKEWILQSFLIKVQKKDLSSKSADGEGSKKVKEGSSDTTSVNIPENVFTESLISLECVAIFLNCIKNVEKQIQYVFDSTIK